MEAPSSKAPPVEAHLLEAHSSEAPPLEGSSCRGPSIRCSSLESYKMSCILCWLHTEGVNYSELLTDGVSYNELPLADCWTDGMSCTVGVGYEMSYQLAD